jgi:hypothetical protein
MSFVLAQTLGTENTTGPRLRQDNLPTSDFMHSKLYKFRRTYISCRVRQRYLRNILTVGLVLLRGGGAVDSLNTLVNAQTNSRLSFESVKLDIIVVGLQTRDKLDVNT